MDVIGRGIIAGFLATLALSAMFHPLVTLARVSDVLPATFGWILHFLVGSLLWGVSFALIERFMRGPTWVRGLLFGFAAWLVVMVTVMPLTRGGWFGIALGLATPAVMLVAHLVYGALLGGIFGFIDPNRPHFDTADSAHDDHLHPLPR